MQPSTPIAYVSPDRAVCVIDPEGRHHEQTAPRSSNLVWGSWRGDERTGGSYSWPTWSPDGRRLACFRLPDDAHPTARVFVLEVGGIQATAVADLGKRLPIYLYWSPDGSQVAILAQRDDRLHLSTARSDAPDGEIPLVEGSPLFFTWAGAGRIAAFVGGRGPGRHPQLSLMETRGARSTTVLPGIPGNFCAPLWVGDQVVYTAKDGEDTFVVQSGPTSSSPHVIEQVEGLVAMIASPNGRLVARAVAPGGDGTPYRQLAVIDIATGEVRTVVDKPCLAFLWCPNSDALVTASVDTRRNLIEWQRVDLDGNIDHVADLHPTRDLGFYLRFFEQYSQSHPIVDPTGRTLLLAGDLEGQGDGEKGTPNLWSVPLDGSPARSLGDALFGVYAPTV